jgi:uncharacterized protein YbjT (DUF2867 family)
MNVLIFGGTGMVGQGVLRECLLASDVKSVTAVGRTATGQAHAKLRELVHENLFDYRAIEGELSGFDACLFCLGVSSSGKTEAEYSRLTYDLTLAAATTLARLNPQMTFIYVSAAGADSRGRSMWARVRGRTEDALSELPLKAHSFRPGVIQALHGERSKTAFYRAFYVLAAPLLPLLRAVRPTFILTTAGIGEAMLEVARHGAKHSVLEAATIYAVAQRRSYADETAGDHSRGGSATS